jgi:hypothetical protein
MLRDARVPRSPRCPRLSRAGGPPLPTARDPRTRAGRSRRLATARRTQFSRLVVRTRPDLDGVSPAWSFRPPNFDFAPELDGRAVRMAGCRCRAARYRFGGLNPGLAGRLHDATKPIVPLRIQSRSAHASRLSIAANLCRSRPIDRLTSQLRHGRKPSKSATGRRRPSEQFPMNRAPRVNS